MAPAEIGVLDLPVTLLPIILRHLDLASSYRLAMINRKMRERLVKLRGKRWNETVTLVYPRHGPFHVQLADGDAMTNIEAIKLLLNNSTIEMLALDSYRPGGQHFLQGVTAMSVSGSQTALLQLADRDPEFANQIGYDGPGLVVGL
ncbi:unnamed protein product, partial [Mesorhabditis spiculigera]